MSALPADAPSFAAVILAGGRSSRMGSWKAALPWADDLPLIASQLRALSAALPAVPREHERVAIAVPADRRNEWIVLVGSLRDQHSDISEALDESVVWINDPAAPPFASLVAALSALASRDALGDWVWMTPVDCPPAAKRVVEQLASAAHGALSAINAIRPASYDAAQPRIRRGHPILLRADWARTLLPLDPATTRLDHLLRDLGEAGSMDVTVNDPLTLANLNTPDEYAAALAVAKNR